MCHNIQVILEVLEFQNNFNIENFTPISENVFWSGAPPSPQGNVTNKLNIIM
jgi:hypothetical protein